MDPISPPRCLSLDLEVGKDGGHIRALAAVRPDTGRTLVHSGRGMASALARLDDVANGASFVLGHNLIAFDLPILEAAKPNLRLLKLPAVDTLRLNPLAFPRKPVPRPRQALPRRRVQARAGERPGNGCPPHAATIR